jgi:hypothetical protein
MAEDKGVVSSRPNGGERSDQIATDIGHTRHQIDRTMDALIGKLTPQQMLLELAGAMKSGSTTIAQKLVETARDHPVPATIIGVGLGMLIMERSDASRRVSGDEGRLHEAMGSVREGAAAAGVAAQDVVHRTEEAASDRLHRAGERALQAVHHVEEKAAQAGAKVSEKASEARHELQDRVAALKADGRQKVHDAKLGFWQAMDRSPLAVAAGAMTLGIAAGLALPRSEKEDELLGESRDRLVGRAKELGRDVLHKGEQVARVAAETVKTDLAAEGLTPSALADTAREIGRDVVQAAKTEAERQHLTPGSAAGRSGEEPPA